MKKSYIINYELTNYYQKNKQIEDIIKELGGDYVCPQPGTWIIKTRLDPIQITEELKPVFSPQDHLLVFQIKNNFWGLQEEGVWKFIRRYIF
ncbi:hypothetical protein [Lentilactobacillus hilgardii]|uniref:hypothetical protein n=1 Tax=Lentilactobacillus hilgardii TaxID=1588 RepID=UPI00019C5CF7|nr:hypothetical protein [Lentilactobacillus hilgardii]EEI19624.1 hypothetical protein HMPREF0497_1609 [Lentilactobacillus buchneri ATCC 11577]MCP9333434.1 hypothetical protein [Lentilactobacillus hilgardii]MCP9350009.1 hypothetical protein [Lentilactobacillus hilgardii]MCP9352591.1 hypothetical protein [Lentilactobacillus hilgardii]QIR10387.1 hypothetical protein G8J22_02395 [Lentilactobacillus hilgardii]